MMILVPALGVPSQEMLQDTLKSCIVALMGISICLLFLWNSHQQKKPLNWHPILFLPLGLAVFAAISMWWSHTYLGGVEMVRWGIFALILWLGINTWTGATVMPLVWGIHWGVTMASLWAACQFWGDLQLFPQGPNPASTFVNRNFFAEFAICALPYSIYLLVQTKRLTPSLLLASNLGFNLCALMMTGTRSALIAFGMLLLLVTIILVRFKGQLAVFGLGWKRRFGILVLLIVTASILGSIPTSNSKLINELGHINANERAFSRGMSMADGKEYTSGSFSIRASMWEATVEMAKAHPWTGVGAGAWEVEVPRYQSNARLTETDYYAHNEILQLIAEYGLVGWSFVTLLLTYLAYAAWVTWRGKNMSESQVTVRAFVLCSLSMLLLVSNAGFPWRTASTGALFALGLSILAASDTTQPNGKPWLLSFQNVSSATNQAALLITTMCLAFAIYISVIAVKSERVLVRSLQASMLIGGSGDPQDARWAPLKLQALQWAQEGIALNPHYRKLTSAIGDQFAQWGDLKTAIWIWESVLASRPHVAALLCNLSRAYMELGNFPAALINLQKAQRLQPFSPETNLLEIELLLRTGNTDRAESRFAELVKRNAVNARIAMLTFQAAKQVRQIALMEAALKWRITHIPSEAWTAWLTLGKTLDQNNDRQEALQAFRAAVMLAPDESKRRAVLDEIPGQYRALLQPDSSKP